MVSDWIQACASLVAAISVPAALVYAAAQTRALREQLKLQTHEQVRSTDAQHAALDMRLLERMLDIDRFFIEHSELRAYVQEGADSPETEPLRAQVDGSAEMIIDFADLVAATGRHNQLSRSDYESWGDFLQWYFRQSPAIRDRWRMMGAMYPPGTRELLVPTDLRGATPDQDGYVRDGP
jgi:hypothetical protein